MSNSWTLERVFASYEEALKYKTSLQMSDRGATTLVKIRMYAPVNGVERFGVKTRTDPTLKEVIKEVEQKISSRKKKG